MGIIDGIHVRIPAESAREDVFVNRHLFHSLNGQLVVVAMSNILNVVSKWLGSVHDSRVLGESAVGRKFPDGTYNGLMLGDHSYPQKSWLLTPFRSPASLAEVSYNVVHGLMRAVVERLVKICMTSLIS